MDDPNNFIGGITIYSDKGERIINYPEQHINNSVIKITIQIINIKDG